MLKRWLLHHSQVRCPSLNLWDGVRAPCKRIQGERKAGSFLLVWFGLRGGCFGGRAAEAAIFELRRPDTLSIRVRERRGPQAGWTLCGAGPRRLPSRIAATVQGAGAERKRLPGARGRRGAVGGGGGGVCPAWRGPAPAGAREQRADPAGRRSPVHAGGAGARLCACSARGPPPSPGSGGPVRTGSCRWRRQETPG